MSEADAALHRDSATHDDRSRQVLAAIVGFAMVLRLRQYLVGRALWHDEAMLALDIRQESLLDLLVHPLERNQVAPFGFLLVEKSLAVVSSADQWLRLAPFGASLVLLWAAWRYAAGLRSTAARVVLLVSVTWSPVLVYYSSELKQYGVDAAATMALLLAHQQRRTHPRRLIVVGAVTVLMSHPAAIVLLAIASTIAVEEIRDAGVGAAVRRLWRHAVVWGFTVSLIALQIRRTSNRDNIDFFWADGFAPLPRSSEGIRWWWDSALGLVHLTTSLRGIASQRRLDEWTDPGIVVSLALLVASVAVLARYNRRSLAVPLSTLVITLALAGFEIYPFRGRVILFLLPIVASLLAHAVDELSPRLPGVAIALAVAVTVQCGWTSGAVLVHPDDRFDIVEALERLEHEIEPGDVVVLGRGTAPAFEFYADDELAAATIRTVEVYDADVVRAVAEGRPVWFLASHVLGGDLDRVESMEGSSGVTYSWTGDAVVLLRLEAQPASG